MNALLEPFAYQYMQNAMLVGALTGGLCALLSAYLVLKGWSLVGDALSHAIVPGIAVAALIGAPFSVGAFFAALLAAGAMLFLNQRSKLKEDVIIGLVLTSFFGLGLFILSLKPSAVDLQTIIMGNILAIAREDVIQLCLIGAAALLFLLLKWKDLLAVFFDEDHARTIGLHVSFLKTSFFIILSLAIVAALQTVGAILVVSLIIAPGAAAILLSDRFPAILAISGMIGAGTCFLGAYISYFLDGSTGGTIVMLQSFVFLTAFFFAPKYGRFASLRNVAAKGKGA